MIYFDGDYIPELVRKVQGTKQSLDICMYVWKFHETDPTLGAQQLYIEILRAKARGVRVRVLTDFPNIAARFKLDGLEAISVPAQQILHAKMFIFDETACGIGSHNITKRSTTRNHEASVILEDYESIAQAKAYFERVWGYYASGKTV